MKKLVWVAGLVLLFAILYPNGIDVSSYFPAAEETTSDADPDATIVKLLSGAPYADKARVVSVYSGLKTVLNRDKGVRVNNTEKFEELQSRTLQMAIDNKGKYEGLDAAIEAVFAAAVKDSATDPTVVNAVTPEMQAKLVNACDIVIASAR